MKSFNSCVEKCKTIAYSFPSLLKHISSESSEEHMFTVFSPSLFSRFIVRPSFYRYQAIWSNQNKHNTRITNSREIPLNLFNLKSYHPSKDCTRNRSFGRLVLNNNHAMMSALS